MFLTITTTGTPRAPRDRPRLPAAQASRQGAGVLHLLRHGPRALPEAAGTALHGRAAAGGRRDGAGQARQGQGPGRRPRTRPSRSTSTTAPTRPPRSSPSRWATSSPARCAAMCKSAPSGRPSRCRCASRSRRCPPRRPRPRTPPLRAARLDGHRRGRPAGHRVPRVGRLTPRPPRTGVRGPHPRRGPAPPLRPPPGPRRRQALLGLARRGRQAAAGRRGLAAQPPGQELITSRYLSRRWSLTREAMDRLELIRLAETDDSDVAEIDNAVEAEAEQEEKPTPLAVHRREAIPHRPPGQRRRPRPRPRLRRGGTWCGNCSRSRGSPRSSAWTCRCARSPSPPGASSWTAWASGGRRA